MVENMQNSVI